MEAAIPGARAESAWAPSRLGFRFVASFFVLYVFPFPLGWLPFTGRAEEWVNRGWHAAAAFAGRHLFHLQGELSFAPNGSGDRITNYLELFCVAAAAAVLAAAWSIAGRPDERRVHGPVRLLVRGVLGWTMCSYGFIKVLPLQMPAPNFTRLIEPYGHSSPMGLAWTFIGASSAYSVFAGAGELVGGALLFFRRTTLAGALILCGVLTNVVMLNFCYDVPVKLYSTTLLAMAIFLVAPGAPRLAAVLAGRAAPPAEAPRAASPLVRRLGIAGQALFVAVVAYQVVPGNWKRWREQKVEPFSGVYRVAAESPQPPPWSVLAVDVFGPRYSLATLGPDAAYRRWTATPHGATWAVFKNRFAAKEEFELRFAAGDADHFTLEGTFDGKPLRATLERVQDAHFKLVERGFHWVNDIPYNY